MSGFLSTEAIGNVGADPVLRHTKDGKAVCDFRIATEERNNEPIWVRVTVWEKLAEICHTYLKKGRQVYARGLPGVSHYKTDAGEDRVTLELTAYKVVFLGHKGDDASADDTAKPAQKQDDDLEDLPF